MFVKLDRHAGGAIGKVGGKLRPSQFKGSACLDTCVSSLTHGRLDPHSLSNQIRRLFGRVEMGRKMGTSVSRCVV